MSNRLRLGNEGQFFLPRVLSMGGRICVQRPQDARKRVNYQVI